MILLKKLPFLLIPALLLTGCISFTGNYLPVKDKNLIMQPDSDYDFNKYVSVIPLTPAFVRSLKPSPVMARSDKPLQKLIDEYEYRIGVGDIIFVTVWGHPELTTPAGQYRSPDENGNRVDSQGFIFYPYIGRVEAGGKTLQQVSKDISFRLAKYIDRPQIDVKISSFRSQKAYITGAVKKPGQQAITNIPLTVLDALNAAGGLSQDANWKQVILTHKGHKKILSLQSLLQYGDLTQNVILHSGDILHISHNDEMKIFVLGEVKEQKTLKIDRSGMTLAEALSKASGIDENVANSTGIFIIRKSKSAFSGKSVNIYQLNSEDASSMVMATNFSLEPDDIVYVTATPLSRWNRVIQQLVRSIGGAYNVTKTVKYLKTL
ncbi:polysaccharide export protein Wza (plasmid) [Pantoea sp. JZ29]|uniref:polysaccharide export protein n=1 Tax=Pantoea sp. JZ29 TaxID=2654192 RepID=UPI002B465466|nr:polysaccharide export protein [Pantoea sp. JZ29]WRH23335.1 polysaccharide export protein Wza [Pantoea sp. JZ29]